MNFERFELKEIEVDLSQLKSVVRCLLHTILFHRALNPIKPTQQECEVFDSITYAKVDDPQLARYVDNAIDRLYLACEKEMQHYSHNSALSYNNSSFSSHTHSHSRNNLSTPYSTPSSNSASNPSSSSSSSFSNSNSNSDVVSVCLGFFETRTKKSWFGSEKEEKLFWERWILPIHLVRDAYSSHGGSSGGGGGTGSGGGGGSGSKVSNSFNDVDRDKRQTQRAHTLLDRLTAIILLVNEKKEHIPPLKGSGGGGGGGGGGNVGSGSVNSNANAVGFPFEISFTSGDKDEEESWGLNTFKKILKQGPPILMN